MHVTHLELKFRPVCPFPPLVERLGVPPDLENVDPFRINGICGNSDVYGAFSASCAGHEIFECCDQVVAMLSVDAVVTRNYYEWLFGCCRWIRRLRLLIHSCTPFISLKSAMTVLNRAFSSQGES